MDVQFHHRISHGWSLNLDKFEAFNGHRKTGDGQTLDLPHIWVSPFHKFQCFMGKCLLAKSSWSYICPNQLIEPKSSFFRSLHWHFFPVFPGVFGFPVTEDVRLDGLGRHGCEKDQGILPSIALPDILRGSDEGTKTKHVQHHPVN